MQKFSKRLLTALSLSVLVAGCTPANLKDRPENNFAMDESTLPKGDLGRSGPEQITYSELEIDHQGRAMTVALYRPAQAQASAPAVVFLPGLMAPMDQYEGYARALASRGFVVVVRGWYSPFIGDDQLAKDAGILADWLIQTQAVNPDKIGVAGHSMGGKDAVWAAVEFGRFAGVVAIDPDDNGRVSVVHGVLKDLKAPLLLIGAEVAWKASSICAPMETNYLRFYEHAPAGTVAVELKEADHVQVMDDPDRFGYGICRSGTADSQQVRIAARRATVAFFQQHLQAGPDLQTAQAALDFLAKPRDTLSLTQVRAGNNL